MNQSLKGWYENHQKELYEKQYVTFPDSSEKHVTEFEDKSVGNDEYKDLRMNTYAQDLFVAKMDDQLLIKKAQHYMSHCGRYNYPATTYDEALIHVIVPELIKRLKSQEVSA